MSLTDDDKQWISEQLEAVETRILTEFHKWASPLDARSTKSFRRDPRPRYGAGIAPMIV